MQLKLDVKTLVIGIVLGFVITAVIGAGAGSADAVRFGIAIESGGAALVRTSDDALYVVNPAEGMAIRVLQARTFGKDFGDARDAKSTPFGLSTPSRPERSERTSRKY